MERYGGISFEIGPFRNRHVLILKSYTMDTLLNVTKNIVSPFLTDRPLHLVIMLSSTEPS